MLSALHAGPNHYNYIPLYTPPQDCSVFALRFRYLCTLLLCYVKVVGWTYNIDVMCGCAADSPHPCSGSNMALLHVIDYVGGKHHPPP